MPFYHILGYRSLRKGSTEHAALSSVHVLKQPPAAPPLTLVLKRNSVLGLSLPPGHLLCGPDEPDLTDRNRFQGCSIMVLPSSANFPLINPRLKPRQRPTDLKISFPTR